MTVKQDPEWSTVEIAQRVMKATSLDGFTIEEMRKLASRVMNDQDYAPQRNKIDPKPFRATPASEIFKRLRLAREAKNKL